MVQIDLMNSTLIAKACQRAQTEPDENPNNQGVIGEWVDFATDFYEPEQIEDADLFGRFVTSRYANTNNAIMACAQEILSLSGLYGELAQRIVMLEERK